MKSQRRVLAVVITNKKTRNDVGSNDVGKSSQVGKIFNNIGVRRTQYPLVIFRRGTFSWDISCLAGFFQSPTRGCIKSVFCEHMSSPPYDIFIIINTWF